MAEALPFGILHQQWGESSISDETLLRETVEDVRRAEQLGFESFMFGEHHFRKGGAPFPSRIPWPELVVAHVAASTGSIRLGTGVKVLALDAPWRTAEAMLTLDLIANGRTFYGLGAGGDEPEVFLPGELDAAGRRSLFRDSLAELLAILRSNGRSMFSNPLTPQRDTVSIEKRLFIAARDTETIARAAAEGLNFIVGQAETALQSAPYVETYRTLGGTAETRAVRIVIVAPTDERAFDWATPAYDVYSSHFLKLRYYQESAAQLYASVQPTSVVDGMQRMCFVVGSPERVARQLADDQSTMGVDRIDILFNLPGLSQKNRHESMRLFAEEVAPRMVGADRHALSFDA